ncbi:MAG: hypothetical protein ACPGWR_26165 [Ardenticatenaceae bacterium]
MIKIEDTRRLATRSLLIGALLYLLGRQSLKVENGQFEREYSRIYTTLVLGIGSLLLLIIVMLLWRGGTHR